MGQKLSEDKRKEKNVQKGRKGDRVGTPTGLKSVSLGMWDEKRRRASERLRSISLTCCYTLGKLHIHE